MSTGAYTIASDNELKQYADTVYSLLTSRYGNSTTKLETDTYGDYISEAWVNVKDNAYPDLYGAFLYASPNSWGGNYYSVTCLFSTKEIW